MAREPNQRLWISTHPTGWVDIVLVQGTIVLAGES